MEKKEIKVTFDGEKEGKKVHDPFIGKRHLREALEGKKDVRWFTEFDMNRILDAPNFSVKKLTGTFLVAYKSPDDGKDRVVDVGLNIVNFRGRVHVP